MAYLAERCHDCSVAEVCANHAACRDERDAGIAAAIGAGWGQFVWGQVGIRNPWPAYEGRCREIALRLVSWLSASTARQERLGEVCCWRAGMRWGALMRRFRADAPYERPDGRGVLYQLPHHDHIWIRFRPLQEGSVQVGGINGYVRRYGAPARITSLASAHAEHQRTQRKQAPPSHRDRVGQRRG